MRFVARAHFFGEGRCHRIFASGIPKNMDVAFSLAEMEGGQRVSQCTFEFLDSAIANLKGVRGASMYAKSVLGPLKGEEMLQYRPSSWTLFSSTGRID